MIKKIISELSAQYGEEFKAEYIGNKVELYSESHFYIYNLKTGELVKMF